MRTNENLSSPPVAAWHDGDPDTRLMLAARYGDTAVFSVLIEKHYRGVLRFCYRKVRDEAAAEDLAQEVFLRVYRYRARYEPTAKFATWMYRIASNVALNWIRDRGREWSHRCVAVTSQDGGEVQVPDRSPGIDERLALDDRAAEVWRAVNELPNRQRAAVLLRNVDDLAGEDIAERLGCSHQAVRSMLCRAYSTLRCTLAELPAAASDASSRV